MQNNCSKKFGSRNTGNMKVLLKNNHVIDINELKKISDKNSGGPSRDRQTTIDKTSICPMTPASIKQFKNTLVKFGIIKNVRAMTLDCPEFLDILKFLRSDAVGVKRHDFEAMDEVIYPQIRCYLHNLNLCFQDSD